MKDDPCLLVIFGGTGDLTRRKLVPSLFNLFRRDLLPAPFGLVGVSHSQIPEEEYRQRMKSAVREYCSHQPVDENDLDAFSQNLFYFQMDFNDRQRYGELSRYLEDLDQRLQTGGRYLFYLATAPQFFSPIASALGRTKLNRATNSGWRRLVVEKPIGRDLNSATQLSQELHKHFAEDQIFRIDHYLGKETVQNILAFRFANGIFEPLWNRNYIHHIEFTAAEFIGVEGRGGYYDRTGALRDMVQNHLMQLLATIAMEPPARFQSEAVRNEKVKVLESLRPLQPENLADSVVLGQYLSSIVRGEKIPGYREEPTVSPESRTETFVALKIFIDNWRWADVPFYMRTGKRLPTRVTEVAIHFRKPPQRLFLGEDQAEIESNLLVIRIQPDEGVLLRFGLKKPGSGFAVKPVGMDFHYSDLADAYIPAAYERLLLDAIIGDPTLYARADEVEASWRFLEPILQAKERNQLKLFGYPAGTWGPPEASALLEGKEDWRYPCKNLVADGEYCEL